MPRVTYEIYHQRHLQLRQLWNERQGVFVLLDPKEQWAVHEYFLCADRPTETELHAHYVTLKVEGSSLPHRAGKAYAELGRRLQAGRPVQKVYAASDVNKGKVLSLRPLVQPRIDLDAYVTTSMQIVDRLAIEDPDRLREMTRNQKLDR
ncbi:hypothetical protein [Arthrobacter sp. 2MCAF14]|uniref:hypothetical protein n=1 Tax=Arthrobacter sp. 2MCAF14 TaxID=3232982 RepID=UPI003F92DDF3